jgi:hypothetical protein
MVSDLRQENAVSFLQSDTAIADHVAAFPEGHSPEAVTVRFIAAEIAGDPFVCVPALKVSRIITHRFRVAEYSCKSVRVLRDELAKQ